MNYNVPDGNMGNDPRSIHDLLSPPNHKKSTGADQELMELLWRNGHVVMHSQNHRKSPPSLNEFRQAHRPEPASKCGLAFESPSNSIQADETISWFQYPLDYTLDKDFCSEFFYEMPMSHTVDTDKLNKNVVDDNNVLLQPISKQSTLCLQESMMPPPNTHVVSLENGGFVNFSHFSRPVRPDLVPARGSAVERVLESRIQKEAGESSSMMTIGSSVCGSNQVQNRPDQSHTLSNDAIGVFASGSKEDVQKKYADTYETTVTSSSGASGSSFGRTEQKSGSHARHKRKGRDGEESECHSQEGEYESVEANRPAQRSASARRSRAAEVHNLSERRRRDRINEKMRALQQLIPHCNKTDKASMLDEAIEYLKSLQLQVQLMWMGSGMTPMMFPGVQHYMSRMGMGMSHATMPSFHGAVPIPRVPLVNQSMPSATTTNQTPMCHPLTFNPLNFPNQMQNAPLPENYARFLSFRHMQPPSQAMNLYPYGSHMVQQSRTLIPSSSGQPTEGGGLPGNIQAGRSS